MKRLIVATVLVWCGLAMAEPLYVLAQEPCVQVDYTQVCPLPADPNLEAIGPILGPIPNDPNTWDINYGKLNRLLLTCDPDGDPYVVDMISSNVAGSAVTHDSATNTWILVADCQPGDAWWHLRITDAPKYGTPISSNVVIRTRVRPAINHAPVLN